MGDVIWNKLDRNYNPVELREAIKEADDCITGWGCGRFEKNVLLGADKLKLIAHTGGSISSIISDYLYDRGIKVISGNKLYAESVAEGTIGYILAALRDIPFYANDIQAGNWVGEAERTEGLLYQNVGLIGFGAVARYITPMLKAFRATVRVYDPYISDEVCTEYGVERVHSLEEIMRGSKIISLHASKIPETYHMIDARLLAMIPDGALLVNTARGNIIDEEALAKELQKARFKAILDVYEIEPLPKDSCLRRLDNVILMPHLAGPTMDRRKVVTFALLEDIKQFFSGHQLKHEIGREYAKKMTT
jgi:phosphoglycerate dehydrogenase-like enzyme